MAQADSLVGKHVQVRRAASWERRFYFGMSLLIAAVVVYGFSFTVNRNLIHPPSARPWVLYVHAAVFSGWLLFFIVQSALVQTRKVAVHRRLGWFGLALGVAIPIVGVATALAMSRLHWSEHKPGEPAFLIVPLWDMVSFTTCFALAFRWRTKPEFHRRLMLMASCGLTAAAFGRFPTAAMQDAWFYAGVDSLILLGALRDVVVSRRVHAVYLYGLPLMMAGQILAVRVSLSPPATWLRMAHCLIGA